MVIRGTVAEFQAGRRYFNRLLNIQPCPGTHPDFYYMDIGVPSRGMGGSKLGRGVTLTTYIRLVPRLSGAMPLHPVCTFMACKGEVGRSAPRPGHFTPREREQVPILQETGWAPGRAGLVKKISPPPGFDPQTVQPVESRYTDWAIAIHSHGMQSDCVYVLIRI
jgi:hypothetical protein